MWPGPVGLILNFAIRDKLLHMLQNADVLMHLLLPTITNIAYDFPLPQLRQQLLNACTIKTVHIIVLLLSSIQLSSIPKRDHYVDAPSVCTIVQSSPRKKTERCIAALPCPKSIHLVWFLVTAHSTILAHKIKSYSDCRGHVYQG